MKKILFVILATVVLASCTTSRQMNSTSYSPGFEAKNQPESLYTSPGETFEQERIVLYNAFITLVVKIPDSTNTRLTRIASKYDGYVQTLGNKTSVIRVKSDKLNSAIADISEAGKVKSKTISGDDVTDQYTDFQIRLENAYNARKRYLELLGKAENVEAALKVEKELERLNGEIDSLEGKLKQLKHLSDYSTITIYMEEKVKPGILGYLGIGLYKSVKWLIVRN
jgi:cell division protein ZapA (FtsZ GTPase activity inhibitor)